MSYFGLVLTCLFFSLAYGQWSENGTRKRINEEALQPEWHWIELPLDHFDVLDNRTYRARYLTNDQFYKKGGPIIVYIGGEWEIANYGVMGGVAFQLARKHNGYLFYPEHRYFGKSLPFLQFASAKNLRYITPDYSIADMLYSLDHLKRTVEGLEKSQVIAVGGSYAGALAIWARLKYPHIVSVAYNCGGVIKTEASNTDYYEVIYDVYKKASPTCLGNIISGIKQAMELAKSRKGTAALQKMWKNELCLRHHNFNIPYAILALFNPQVWAVYKPHQTCFFLDTNTTGSPLERLYQTYVAIAKENGCPDIDLQWNFLVCTFYGNILNTHDKGFGKLDFLQQIEAMCMHSYGPQFTKDFVYRHTNRTQLLFGSNTPDVTKVLSVQGTHDPWKTHSIVDELNEDAPVVYVQDASHCLELGEEQDDETPQVTQSKLEILEQLSKWII